MTSPQGYGGRCRKELFEIYLMCKKKKITPCKIFTREMLFSCLVSGGIGGTKRELSGIQTMQGFTLCSHDNSNACQPQSALAGQRVSTVASLIISIICITSSRKYSLFKFLPDDFLLLSLTVMVSLVRSLSNIKMGL